MADRKQLADIEIKSPESGSDDCEKAYSIEYLREIAQGDSRAERLAELRRRIALGAYRIDPARIAETFLLRRTASDS